MAATGYTPISLYYSTTASAVPTAGNLANGELALNIADMKLYAKNSAGTVTLLASNSGATGTVSSVSGTGTVSGITLSGTVTSSGSLTLGGALDLSAYNGAGAFTTLSASGAVTLSGGTANGVTYLNGSKVLTSGSALTFDGTNLGVNCTATNFGANYRTIEARGATTTTSGVFRASSSDASQKIDFFIDSGVGTLRTDSNHPLAFAINNTEQMRLTSTGLGIGTSSPAYKLHAVKTGGGIVGRFDNADGVADIYGYGLEVTRSIAYIKGSGALHLGSAAGYSAVVLDSAGNLGLGVTPSATSGGKSLEIGYVGSSVMSTATGQMNMTANVYYNSGWKYAGTGTALLYQQSATGVNAWYTAASGTAGNAISWTQAMTLDASGNLGVGTTSPSARVEIAQSIGGGNGVGLILNDFGSSGANEGMHIQWRSGTDKQSDQCRIGQISNATGSGSNLAFYTNGADTGTATERARISSTGGFSVGTTADPGAGAIYATGAITAYYSDERLKDVKGRIQNALAKVRRLSGVYYTNNETAKALGYTSDEMQVGVLANQMKGELPEIVKPAPFDLDENGNSKSGENYMTVQYERGLPLLIEALKELADQFDDYVATH